MKQSCGFIFTIFFLFLLLIPSRTYCQKVGNSEKKQLAKKYFREGVSYYESGKHAQALESFQKSYEIKPHWAIRFNLGLCYKELGMYVKAREEFNKFVEEGGSKINPSTKKQVEQAIAELNNIIAVVTIEVNVKKAEILMDGKTVGYTPMSDKVYLNPGSHILIIQKNGYESYREEFILSKGERKSFKIYLLPTSTVKPEQKEKEEEKSEKETLQIEIEKEGKRKRKMKIGWALPTLIATTSIAVASAGAGSAMIALAYQKKSDLDSIDKKYKNAPESFESYQQYVNKRKNITDEGKLYVTLTYTFYTIAGVAGIGSVLITVLAHPFKKKTTEMPPSSRKQAPYLLFPAFTKNEKMIYAGIQF